MFDIEKFKPLYPENYELIKKAYEFAAKAHEGQKRRSGEDYITHPCAVAEIVAEFGFDASTVVAAFLHDTLEDTPVTDDQIKTEFGEEILELVVLTDLYRMSAQISLRGCLQGHNGWVTSIAASPVDANTLVSSSRDHTCLVWKLQAGEMIEDPSLVMSCGTPLKSLQGHSHIVEEVSLSVDGQYALTASWDGTVRLWNVNTGKSEKTLSGHKKDVLSVCFSPDNRLIMSCGRDRTIKLWNTLGECQFTLDKESHNDWVTCVRFVPNMEEKPRIVSCGYDKLVKVWNLETMKVEYNLIGHSQVVNKVVVSPDGVLCASAGKDGCVIVWDLANGVENFRLTLEDPVTDLVFSPANYWIAVATTNEIVLFDLETKERVASVKPEFPPRSAKALVPYCTSLCWSLDGATLFAGYTDNVIRVWEVKAM